MLQAILIPGKDQGFHFQLKTTLTKLSCFWQVELVTALIVVSLVNVWVCEIYSKFFGFVDGSYFD